MSTDDLAARVAALADEHLAHGRGFYAFCTLCNSNEAESYLRALLPPSDQTEAEPKYAKSWCRHGFLMRGGDGTETRCTDCTAPEAEPSAGLSEDERESLHDAMAPWARAMPHNVYRDLGMSDGIWTRLDKAVERILAARTDHRMEQSRYLCGDCGKSFPCNEAGSHAACGECHVAARTQTPTAEAGVEERLAEFLPAIRQFMSPNLDSTDVCLICEDMECGGACPDAVYVVRQVMEAFDSADDVEYWREWFTEDGLMPALAAPAGEES